MRIKYRETIEGKMILEIVDTDINQVEKLRAEFSKQNAPTTVHSFNDCDGSWVVSVMNK